MDIYIIIQMVSGLIFIGWSLITLTKYLLGRLKSGNEHSTSDD